jgi:hypothetical protein
MKNWSDYFSDKKFRSIHWPAYTIGELSFKGFEGDGLTDSHEETGTLGEILNIYTKQRIEDEGKALPSNNFRIRNTSQRQ